MNHLLRMSTLLCVLLVLAAGFAILIGRRSPPPASITAYHLADCAPPCWIGIVPGQTTLGEVEQRLKAVFNAQYSFKVEPASQAMLVNPSDSVGTASVYIQTIQIVRDKTLLTTVGIYNTAADIPTSDLKLTQLNLIGSLKERLPTPAEILSVFGRPQCVLINESYIELIYSDPKGLWSFGLSDARQDFNIAHPFPLIHIWQSGSGEADCQEWQGFKKMWR